MVGGGGEKGMTPPLPSPLIFNIEVGGTEGIPAKANGDIGEVTIPELGTCRGFIK